MIIYIITNLINNKQYVGKTTKSLKLRWRRHCSRKHTAISKAIIKYGKENFKIEVLEYTTSLEELNNLEIEWINKKNTLSPNGYNLINYKTESVFTENIINKIKNIQHKLPPKSNNKSGFKGVYKHNSKFWRSYITINKKRIELGLFKCPIEAALAYDYAVIKYLNGNGYINFRNCCNE